MKEVAEVPQPGPAEALSSLLDVEMPDLEREGLPLLWHWFYLLDRPAQADLGPDGHPVRATTPAPPEPGRRRMWAGGRVRTLGPLRCGLPATRRTEVLSVQEKQGRTGRLTFVVTATTSVTSKAIRGCSPTGRCRRSRWPRPRVSTSGLGRRKAIRLSSGSTPWEPLGITRMSRVSAARSR
ncbi:hypothetical protein [Amycolatopsis sp. BJA-103]|uniref:hypothetical protein n=1 Tax=Amycolatopsis sp. BJA-103 TaxID=1911175 RepID=UPI000CA148D5|nr:hypothetical protein [Amycolatopsis sp. BJA-103]AUI59738.1 hypothetical protein BKN51_16995 [Amycolatopsis sp. BJA-103]